MAAGDVVSGITIYSAGGFLTFQAAAGVEVAVTQVCANAGYVALYDGTTEARFNNYDGEMTGIQNAPTKLMINNSIYLRTSLGSSASNAGFCGIQIK
tara:strand:- start:770 stop:1060 length:291 start_codon:yes stop_codon:yes gene_type:complete